MDKGTFSKRTICFLVVLKQLLPVQSNTVDGNQIQAVLVNPESNSKLSIFRGGRGGEGERVGENEREG